MKTGAIIAIAAVLVVAAFAGGWYVGQSGGSDVASMETSTKDRGDGTGPTEEDRAAMESMSPEERQAFMREQAGEDGPPGRGAGAGAPGGGMRAVTIEGEVVEFDTETLTVAIQDGGSQTFYLDEETTIALAEGLEGEITAGRSVQLVGEPEADGVASATLVVIVE